MINIKIRENNREDFKIIQRHDILKKKKKNRIRHDKDTTIN